MKHWNNSTKVRDLIGVPAITIAIQYYFGSSTKCNSTRILNDCYKHWKKQNKTAIFPTSGHVIVHPENPKDFRKRISWK